MALLALPDDEVHVWLADPADLAAPARAAAARALLIPSELARNERFHFEEGRLLHLATRKLVRTVLSRYEPVAPVDWRFVENEHGCPSIAGHQGLATLRFNLSNTRGLVACAVARGVDVGVDVEPVDRRAPLAVADRYFAAAEVAELNALPEDARPARFFDYWTLKESYIKARGMGLAIPLGKFAFVLRPDEPPRVELDPSLGDDAASWCFRQMRPTAEHLLGLCVRRRDGRDPRVRTGWNDRQDTPA